MLTRMKHVLLMAGFLVLCGSAVFAHETVITILHVNDTHAHLDSFGPKNIHMEGELGGIARAATIINEVRATEPNVLLLHAGDISHGDLFFNKFLDIPELNLMRSLGFDAMTVGNHEFDLGPDPLTYCLSAALPNGEIPLLSANLDMSGYPALTNWVHPWIIKTVGGVKVGIFGMTVFDDPMNMPAPVVISPDIVPAAVKAIDDLHAQGAKVIICLSHLGIRYDRVLASAVSGIDFIVGGHDHELLSTPEAVTSPSGKRTLIVQAGDSYKYVGELRIAVRGDGSVNLKDWHTIPVTRKVPAVPEIQAVVDGLKAEIVAQYGRVYDRMIAMALAPLEKEFDSDSPLRDTPLGNLVTDAFRRLTGTQIAFTPLGLISEKIYQGPIVGADVFRAMSYGYDPAGSGYGFHLVSFTIQGMELVKALEITLAQVESNTDFFPQVSGMKFTYDLRNQPGGRVDLSSIRIGSGRLNPAAEYTVTANEAVAYLLGQLGVTITDVQPRAEFEYPVVHDFVKKLCVVMYRPEGRIRDVSVACGRNEKALAQMEEETPRQEVEGSAAKEYALLGGYPNPFNPSTTVRFALRATSRVSMKIYNSIGQEVTTLVDGREDAGLHEVRWDASSVASGVYFCRMTAADENGAGQFTATQKLLLVK